MNDCSPLSTTKTLGQANEPKEIKAIALVDEQSKSADEAVSNLALPTRDRLVDEINGTYAYMQDIGAVLHEYYEYGTSHWTYRFIPVRQFKNNVANMPFTDDPEEGTRAKADTGQTWLIDPGRRSYQEQVFRPQGLTEEEEQVYFNTFLGFGFDPIPGACDLFWDHVRDNIAHGDEQLLAWIREWLAALIQHPEQRASVALVLRGEQGTGKGVFAQTVGKLLGQHFLHLTSPEVLTGKFNSILQNKPFVFADEAFWAGDKKGESRLKTLITEERIIVEEKYLPAYHVANVMHLVIASNDDWVVPAGRNERRFAVFNMSNAQMQKRAYFKAIIDELESGGYEALLHELQNVEIGASGVDPHVAPVTEALTDQQVLSMDPVEQYWYACLEEGRAIDFHEKWGEEVNGTRCIATELLYRRYVEQTSMGRIHRSGSQQCFSKSVKKLMPPSTRIARKSVRFFDGPDSHASRRVTRCFVVPSLSACRSHFKKLFPKIVWDVPASEFSREPVRAQSMRGAVSLPRVRNLALAVVEDEFDDFVEPDWASDEPLGDAGGVANDI